MSAPTVADRFVAKQIKKFPMLYQNRTQVLHYVLCLIGNGYEWTDRGTVKYREHSRLKSSALWDYDTYMAEAEASFADTPPLIKEILMEGDIKIGKALQKIVDKADMLALTPGKLNMNVYPQTADAMLMNMPDNIHPSWRAACEEIKAEVSQHGWKFPD